jgi:hypothetical protein
MKYTKLDNEIHRIQRKLNSSELAKPGIDTPRMKLVKTKALNTLLNVVMVVQEVNKITFFDLYATLNTRGYKTFRDFTIWNIPS